MFPVLIMVFIMQEHFIMDQLSPCSSILFVELFRIHV